MFEFECLERPVHIVGVIHSGVAPLYLYLYFMFLFSCSNLGIRSTRPVHIVGDDHSGVPPLHNEIGVQGHREVFVRHLRIQVYLEKQLKSEDIFGNSLLGKPIYGK